MRSGKRRSAVCTVSSALAGMLLVATLPLQAEDPAGPQQTAARSGSAGVSVQLPAGTGLFPAGAGADVANAQCLICHSVDMVLYQPARTKDEWKATINKMRTAYGAPISIDQIDTLASYLAGLP